jgi:hypothetical protein
MRKLYQMRAVSLIAIVTILISVLNSVGVEAAETVTYKYDALGRLKKTTKAGGPANGQQTKTNHDAAGNRKCQSTSGVGGTVSTSCPQP